MDKSVHQCPGTLLFFPLRVSSRYLRRSNVLSFGRPHHAMALLSVSSSSCRHHCLFRGPHCCSFHPRRHIPQKVLLGARDPRTQAYSIGSNLLVLLSPLWVNAFAYMVVGRMIYYWLPSKSIWRLKARTLTSWFVWLDVLTFFVQATGGSMLENEDPGSAKLGLYICKRCSTGTSSRTLLTLARYGWNWLPAGFFVAFPPHNDQIQCRRRPAGASSTHFLAPPLVLPVHRPCSHYRAYTLCEYNLTAANRN